METKPISSEHTCKPFISQNIADFLPNRSIAPVGVADAFENFHRFPAIIFFESPKSLDDFHEFHQHLLILHKRKASLI